ncbi:MAG: ABC transporter ATP-binding protein [Desulfobacter sp.]|nr:ABC transporter ATP-binding protein [Desulfobacter sp.]
MLEVTDAGKSFDNQTIFKAFNLTVQPGQFTVLVGPSGCGKSTLFNGLTGITALDRGTIFWKGRPLDHVQNHAAYIQQKDLLLPWFTLLDNSLLPARTRKTRSFDIKKDKALAKTLFERLGLKGYENHYPNQVSGGMRQRCALVRTLIFRRELILLDEPLSALDAITRQGLQTLLLMLQSEFSKTILMITHDIEEALVLGDEICLLGPRPMSIVERFVPRLPKPRAFDHPDLIAAKAHMMTRLQEDIDHVKG